MYYSENPLSVVKIDPLDENVIDLYCVVGSVSSSVHNAILRYENSPTKHESTLIKHFGKDFKRKLLINKSHLLWNINIPVKYVFYNFYPEDRLYEIRDKISIITNVPIYEQNLFFYRNETIENFYYLKLEQIYDVDILNINKTDNKLYGIPIDKNVLKYKQDYELYTRDYRELFGQVDVIYFTQLSTIMDKMEIDKATLIDKTFEFELLYYGLILKYFPQITIDIFKLYLGRENIKAEYPLFFPKKETYEKQDKFMTVYDKVKDDHVKDFRNNISKSVIRQDLGFNINIRNLFDLYRVSYRIPILFLKSRNRLVIKNYIYTKDKYNLLKDSINGVHFVLNLEKFNIKDKTLLAIIKERYKTYILVSISENGVLTVTCSWNPENEVTFETNETIVQLVINPFIKELSDLVSKNLKQIYSIQYSSINISVIWYKMISTNGFKFIKETLSDLMESGILAFKQNKNIGVLEYYFKKGVHSFDQNPLTYSYYTNSHDKALLENMYYGKVMYLFHKVLNLKFELYDITKEEYITIENMIKVIIHIYNSTKIDDSIKKGNINRLKKLREYDPELFNIKKEVGDKTYSEICQQKYQPDVLSEEQYSALSTSERKSAVKYWNFTLGKPAYYYCDHVYAKNVSFITNKHPKNYCLPCCKKLEASKNEINERIFQSCITDHKYDSIKHSNVAHILSHSRELPPGRVGHVTPMLQDIIPNLYVYGIEQRYGDIIVPILHLLEFILEQNIQQIVLDFIVLLEGNDALFNVLLGGDIISYFGTLGYLLHSMRKIFVEQDPLFIIHFYNWDELFIELSHCLFELLIIGFDDDNMIINTRFYNTFQKHNNLIVMYYKFENKIYPIMKETETVVEKGFKLDSPEIATIKNILDWSKTDVSVPDLDIVKKFAELNGMKIDKYLIFVNNLCYAVIVDGKYFPINLTYINEDKNIVVMKYESGSFDLEEFNVIFLKFNKFLLENGFNPQVISAYIVCNGDLVAIRTNDFVYSVQSKKFTTDRPVVNIKYDIAEVNNAIYKSQKKMGNSEIFNARQIMLYNMELYNNTLYQQLIYEIIHHIESEKNVSLREKLGEIIKKINAKNFKSRLVEIKGLVDNEDYLIIENIIYKHIAYYKPKIVLGDFDLYRFNFDNKLLNKLKKGGVRANIRQLLDSKIEYGELDLTQMNKLNMIFSCNTGVGFCSNKKVIINNKKLYEEFIDIIAKNIENGNFEKYVIPNINNENYISYFNFILNSDEKIIILNI